MLTQLHVVCTVKDTCATLSKKVNLLVKINRVCTIFIPVGFEEEAGLGCYYTVEEDMLLEVVGKLQAEVEDKLQAEVEDKPVAEDRLVAEEEGSQIGHLPGKEKLCQHMSLYDIVNFYLRSIVLIQCE